MKTSIRRWVTALGGLVSFSLAAAAFVLAYRIVFVLRLGPTAATLSDQQGWGLHTGDVLALPVSLVGALCVALGAVCLHEARPRPPLVVLPRAVNS